SERKRVWPEISAAVIRAVAALSAGLSFGESDAAECAGAARGESARSKRARNPAAGVPRMSSRTDAIVVVLLHNTLPPQGAGRLDRVFASGFPSSGSTACALRSLGNRAHRLDAPVAEVQLRSVEAQLLALPVGARRALLVRSGEPVLPLDRPHPAGWTVGEGV